MGRVGGNFRPGRVAAISPGRIGATRAQGNPSGPAEGHTRSLCATLNGPEAGGELKRIEALTARNGNPLAGRLHSN